MDSRDYQEIRQLFDDYLQMYASRDDSLTTHFSDDFSGITGSGDNLTKDREEWVAITRLDFAQVKDPIRIELKDLAIQRLADTIAVTTGFFTIHLPIKDHVLSKKTARLVLIFRKESDGWKICHSSISIPFGMAHDGEVYPLKELEERNLYLEDLVVERTAQLQAANDKLQEISLRRLKITSRVPGVIYQFRLHPDGTSCLPFASDKVQEVFRVTPEEVLEDASKIFANIHPDDLAGVNRWIQKSAQDMVRLPFEFRVKFDDGTERWLLSDSQPELESDGSVLWHGFITDITDRKKIEAILEKKSAEIEQFIYTVSHDLRTPLVTVKTFLGFLESDMITGNQNQISQDVQFINAAADKMKLLLDELLELSRIGYVEIGPIAVSFINVISEVQEVLAGVIKESSAIILQPDTDQVLVGDRLRLCQIWQNLIENAIKYRQDDRVPVIELGVKQMNGETVFFVKDNGIGVDPQYHHKIFGIFEQLNQQSSGAGMGLALVRRITEKYDGRIWVESEGVGKGSCFFFTLPNAVVRANPSA
jgi:PAS domain S-box-containing protein